MNRYDVNEVRKDFPNIQIIWMNTTHSGKAEEPDDVPTIHDGVWTR